MRYLDPSLQRGVIDAVEVTPLSGDDWTPGPVASQVRLVMATFLQRVVARTAPRGFVLPPGPFLLAQNRSRLTQKQPWIRFSVCLPPPTLPSE
jgi:hypothetical protein